MAEKKKKKKPIENMPQEVKPKHAIPGFFGSDLIRGVDGAVQGVNQGMMKKKKKKR